jgi:uncharacterized protein YlzI (FlbEa/FlbD family)
MLSTTLIIDGYEFEFTVGSDSYCGVILRDDNSHLEETNYRQALYKAFRCIPILEAQEYVNHYYTSSYDIYTLRDHTLQLANRMPDTYQKLMDSCIIIINQRTIEIGDRDIVYAKTILSIIDGTYNIAPQYTKSPPKKKAIPGYVYLISGSKSYKIGMSKTPIKRIEKLSVVLPFPIKTIALIESQDIKQLEQQLHKRFADKRINGEWFDLSPEDIEYIKGLQS